MRTIMILQLILTISMYGQDSINVRFLEKINTLRSSKGLPILIYDASLYPVALKWAKYITNKLHMYPTDTVMSNHKKDMHFTHVDYKKRFKEVLKRNDVSSVSENLHFIMGTDPDIDFVDESFVAWKKSRYHYESMIDSTNSNIAFGHYYDKSTRRLLSIIVLTEEEKK